MRLNLITIFVFPFVLVLSLFSLKYSPTPYLWIFFLWSFMGLLCTLSFHRPSFRLWSFNVFMIMLIFLGFESGHNIPIRVEGIDAPEIRGKCQKEKDLAYEARDLVRGLLKNALSITLTIDDNPKEVRGKYFRIVGKLIADDMDISDILIQKT